MVCPFCAELGDPMLCEFHEMEIVARHATPPAPDAVERVVRAACEVVQFMGLRANPTTVWRELCDAVQALAASRAGGAK